MSYRGRGRGGGRGRGRGGYTGGKRYINNNNDNVNDANDDNQEQGEKTLAKPKFIKVDKLEPGSKSLNLIVKVVKVDVIVEETYKPSATLAASVQYSHRPFRPPSKVVAEVVVGDDSGTVIMSVSSQKQLQVVQEAFNSAERSIVIRGARTVLFRSNMRLKVEEPFGAIQILHDPATQKLYSEEFLQSTLNDKFTVNTSKDMSAQLYRVEYVE
jgi:hypothetical protein